MKKVIFAVLISCGVWSGTRTVQMNCASAQTGMSPGIVPSITNQLGFTFTNPPGFTNTLIPAADLSAAQLTDVATLLLSLQTNVELTLPVLAVATTNATLVNHSSASQFRGFVRPLVTSPGSFLPPTGAANGANTGQQIGFAITLGTNTFAVDQQTFQDLLNLRDDLQRTLPVLQALNGTSPTNTSGTISNSTNPTQALTNFGQITNGFTTPLTNQPQFLNAPSPF